jgi:hypothetical protein
LVGKQLAILFESGKIEVRDVESSKALFQVSILKDSLPISAIWTNICMVIYTKLDLLKLLLDS